MDALKSFEITLIKEDYTEAENVVQSLPKAKDFLDVILRTGKYEGLKAIVPLIGNDDLLAVADVMLLALKDDVTKAKELLDLFENHKVKHKIIEHLSFAWGKNLLPWDKLSELGSYGQVHSYKLGIISMDAVELLPERITDHDLIVMGAVYAKKCMDREGYYSCKLHCYMQGARRTRNDKTMQLLKEKNPKAYKYSLKELCSVEEMLIFGY